MPSSTSSSERRALRGWLRDLAGFGLALALALAGLEALIRYRLPPEDPGKYAEGPPPATLVLGSSTAYFGLDPRPLAEPGRPAYNAALQAAGPRFWRPWYELVARPRYRPARVLIDVPWFWEQTVMTRRLEHDADRLPADVFARLLLRPDVDVRAALYNRLAVIKHRRDFMALVLGRFPVPPARGAAGWLPGDGPFRGNGDVPARPLDPAAMGDFEALLDDLAADGAQVVLLQSPSYMPAMPPLGPANASLVALARRRGLPFLNYNAERRGPLNEDRGAFSDGVHLTRRGATRFSTTLAADLRAAGLLGGGDPRTK